MRRLISVAVRSALALGHGRIQAVAEPVRLFGGSALVVHPAH